MDESQRHRSAIRIAVIALLLVMPAQLVVALLVAEPYPAAIGPGFAGRPMRNGVVRFTDCNATISCSDRRSETRRCSKLISGTGNRSLYIVQALFPPVAPRCEEPRLDGDAGLRAALLYPRAIYRHAYARCSAPSTAVTEWIGIHSARAAGCAEPHSVEIVWEKVEIDVATKQESRELLARHGLDFVVGGQP